MKTNPLMNKIQNNVNIITIDDELVCNVNKENDGSFHSGSSEIELADIDYVLANKAVSDVHSMDKNKKNQTSSCHAVKNFNLIEACITLENSSDADEIKEIGSPIILDDDNFSSINHLKSKCIDSPINNNQQTINDYSDNNSTKRNEGYLATIIDSENLMADKSNKNGNNLNIISNDSMMPRKSEIKSTSSNDNVLYQSSYPRKNSLDKKQFSICDGNVSYSSKSMNNILENDNANFETNYTPVGDTEFDTPSCNENYRKKLGLPPMNLNLENDSYAHIQSDNKDMSNKLNKFSDNSDFFENSQQLNSINSVQQSTPSNNSKRKFVDKIITDFYPSKTNKLISEINDSQNHSFVSTQSKSKGTAMSLNQRQYPENLRNDLQSNTYSYATNLTRLSDDLSKKSSTKGLQSNEYLMSSPNLVDNLYGNSRRDNIIKNLNKFIRKVPSNKLVHSKSNNDKPSATVVSDFKSPSPIQITVNNQGVNHSQNHTFIHETASNEIQNYRLKNEMSMDGISNEQLNQSLEIRHDKNHMGERILERSPNQATQNTCENDRLRILHQSNKQSCFKSHELTGQSNFPQCSGMLHDRLALCGNSSQNIQHPCVCKSVRLNDSTCGIRRFADHCLNSHLNHCCLQKRAQFNETLSTQMNDCNCVNCVNTAIQHTRNQNDYHLCEKISEYCVCGNINCKRFNSTSLQNELPDSHFHENVYNLDRQPCHKQSLMQNYITYDQGRLNHTCNLNDSHSKYFVTNSLCHPPSQHRIDHSNTLPGNCRYENHESCSHPNNDESLISKCSSQRKRKIFENICNHEMLSQLLNNSQNWIPPNHYCEKRYDLPQSQQSHFMHHTNAGNTLDYEDTIFSPLSEEDLRIHQKENIDTEYLSGVQMLKFTNPAQTVTADDSDSSDEIEYRNRDAMLDGINYSQRDMFDDK